MFSFLRIAPMNRTAEIAEKTERLVKLIAREGLGGLLINAQHNFAWLTCGGGNGIDLSRDAGAGWLFVRGDGRRFVLANRIEMRRLLDEELAGLDYEAIEFGWEEEKSDANLVVKRARSLLSREQLIGSDLPVSGSDKVVEAAITRARGSLTAPEIERYRALGRDAGDAVGRLVCKLEPGQTEVEVARLVTHELAACGARSVVTLVAADDRIAKYRHPVPTERRWREMVMVVVCARRSGLLASLTRIVCAGSAPKDLVRRTEACARVNGALLASTKPGVAGHELYQVAARGYELEGFPGEERLHHQGGATGYRTREWVAHPRCEERVQASQAFAWNPSITGTKTEESCLAFEDRVEIVTASPGWPAISIEAGERKYVLPGILTL